MEIDLASLKPTSRYKLLASLVTPRPIAWITTIDGMGRVNAAPFSFFNVFGSDPALVAFAPGNRQGAKNGEAAILKDTARNIRETHEFVIHLVTPNLTSAMVTTAKSLPPGESELDAAHLTTTPSLCVSPPRITQASVALECTEYQTIEIGSNRLTLGIVQHLHVADELIEPETLHIDSTSWQPIGRMASPDWYCRTDLEGSLFQES